MENEILIECIVRQAFPNSYFICSFRRTSFILTNGIEVLSHL